MKNVIKFLEKYFPNFLNKLKDCSVIKDIYSWICLGLFVIKKEKSLFIFFIKSTFSYYILKKKSDITFCFKGNKITMPRHLKWLDWFIEVRSDKFYERIRWYNHVLDLWGYIWDSALKFGKENKKVTVYEAHPDNFKYLIKNTEHLKNIIAYNKAVVWNKSQKTVKIYWGSFNMWAWNWHVFTKNQFIEVPAISILEILRNDDFDALKMDIEWAEYECLDSIIISEDVNFLFKEWFIEFHLSKNKDSDLNKILWYINRLEKKTYKLTYYDVINNKDFSKLSDLKVDVFLVHFSR